MEPEHNRRASDPRIDTIISDVATLKLEMAKNTEVTQQVRDILNSFRIFGTVAKWVTVVAGAVTAAYHAAQVVFHK